MTEERDPSDNLPEDPPPTPKPKRKKRKPKALAQYSIRHKGKRYTADVYEIKDGLFSFTQGAKTTFLPVSGPIEVLRSQDVTSQPVTISQSSWTTGYQPVSNTYVTNPDAERFNKSRNSQLAALSGAGSEFVGE